MVVPLKGPCLWRASFFSTPLFSCSALSPPGQSRDPFYASCTLSEELPHNRECLIHTLIASFFKPSGFLFSGFSGIKNVSPGHVVIKREHRATPHTRASLLVQATVKLLLNIVPNVFDFMFCLKIHLFIVVFGTESTVLHMLVITIPLSYTQIPHIPI